MIILSQGELAIMQLYQWYVIISAILVILEIYVPGFVLLPIGVAGLCTSLVAYLRPELWLHAVFFICGSGLALLAVREMRDKLDQSKPTTTLGPVGQNGIVIALPEGTRGLQVKVFGDTWEVLENTIPKEHIPTFGLGTSVKITGIVGNKITIEKN